MHTYTVNLLNVQGKRRRRALLINCKSDDDAIQHVAFQAHPYAIEINEGERLVWRFEPHLVNSKPADPPTSRSR